MIQVLNEFISTYGATILYSMFTAITAFVGVAVKRLYEKYINTQIKKDVVKDCVKAVEQIYKDLHGEEKYNKAVEYISEILEQKGINITELEIKMLIESVCHSFNENLNK